MSNVRRVYVEKKPDFAVKAKELKHEIKHYLGITTVEAVRVLIRYDVENISEETYKKALYTVFSEPPVDDIYEETFDYGDAKVFTVEFLPGQFDQRADSAEQCVKLLNENEEPIIRSAITYVIEGAITDEQFAAIKKHCINPVDSRAIGMEKPKTLVQEFDDPADVIIFDGFKDMAEDKLKELYLSLNLAMTFKDFLHIQNYFKNEEKRDPSMTEIRVLDTYWSDHCRHTTFSTELKNVKFDDGFYRTPIENTYKDYLNTFSNIYKDRNDKFVCLMDLALLAMKRLKAEGKLDDQEESDEINACSIVVPVEVDGKTEEWLVNFKNETHNHPTEIEPFGGAATCLGGAIRDPLSGRTYVYQAMRVTGAADPTVPVSQTIEGKLPQKKLVREQLTDTAHMETRSDLQQAMSRRFTIQIMLQSVWRSVQLWVRLQDVLSRDLTQIREIKSFYSEDAQDVTESVVLQVHQRHTIQSLHQYAELRYKRVMHLQRESFRDFSEEKRSAISSRNVTISVPAEFLLLSESLLTDFA